VVEQGGNGYKDLTTTSTVAIFSGQWVYLVSAGALNSDPSKGQILVVKVPRDPCANSTAVGEVNFYGVPSSTGAVTLTGVEDTSVVYETARGSSGHFDVVGGTFS
jgi:hypothetical protein